MNSPPWLKRFSEAVYGFGPELAVDNGVDLLHQLTGAQTQARQEVRIIAGLRSPKNRGKIKSKKMVTALSHGIVYT